MNRDKSAPYCMIFTSSSPHDPWNAGDASAYNAGSLTLPSFIANTPETRAALTTYYAEITDLDREVGLAMDIVEGTGEKDNTLFIFTSEQGSIFPGAKWSCYDLGLQVGFIARWPAEIASGTETDAMINYVDVVPTLIEAAGGKALDSLDGRSFLPVLFGETNEHNKVAYGIHTQLGANGSPPTGYGIRSIRTETHKYIWNLNHTVSYGNWITNNTPGWYTSWVSGAENDTAIARLVDKFLHRPEEELYDIIKDPLEEINLSALPQYRSLMDSLRTRLDTWMKQQGDKGQETELAAETRK